MSNLIKVECDERGVHNVAIEAWAKWALGILGTLVALGIPTMIGLSVQGAIANSAIQEKLFERGNVIASHEARIANLEASLWRMSVTVEGIATDLTWIKEHMERGGKR